MLKFIKFLVQKFLIVYYKVKLPYLSLIVLAKIFGFSIGVISLVSVIYFLPILSPLRELIFFLYSLVCSFFSFIWRGIKEFINFLFRLFFGEGDSPASTNNSASDDFPGDDFPGPKPGNHNSGPNNSPNDDNISNFSSQINAVNQQIDAAESQLVENQPEVEVTDPTSFSGDLAPSNLNNNNQQSSSEEQPVLQSSSTNSDFPSGGGGSQILLPINANIGEIVCEEKIDPTSFSSPSFSNEILGETESNIESENVQPTVKNTIADLAQNEKINLAFQRGFQLSQMEALTNFKEPTSIQKESVVAAVDKTKNRVTSDKSIYGRLLDYLKENARNRELNQAKIIKMDSQMLDFNSKKEKLIENINKNIEIIRRKEAI